MKRSAGSNAIARSGKRIMRAWMRCSRNSKPPSRKKVERLVQDGVSRIQGRRQMPLQASTPNDTDIVVVRTFNAPRQLVWDAHTKPELVKRWLTGPDGWSMPEC